MQIVPAQWQSDRLIVSNLEEHEIEAVQQLFETSRYMNKWDGHEYNPMYVKNCYSEGFLPPGGKKEQYRFQTIRTLDSSQVIGMISLYHGYPVEKSVYVEFLYFHQSNQQQGYGQELIKRLSQLSAELGYSEIRANVSIKIWSAIRFWIKAGFNQVSGLYGDREHSENTFADIELIKSL